MNFPTPAQVRQWILDGLECAHLEVRGDGRHFEALIVSESFAGLSPVRRHQKVYAALGDKMHSEIHALSMRALSPAEWDGQT
ncbi:MAG: BolA family transcriptional regulator [Betaproteobacteria bacterium]|nr:BolA family transcriptional regulator [Betaproteobacteria bacterium]